MGPVIDETWTLVQDEGDDEVAHARAMLAAQAPAMAKCLLELLGDSPCSPLCNHVLGSRNYCQADKVRRVLRAAGVLP